MCIYFDTSANYVHWDRLGGPSRHTVPAIIIRERNGYLPNFVRWDGVSDHYSGIGPIAPECCSLSGRQRSKFGRSGLDSRISITGERLAVTSTVTLIVPFPIVCMERMPRALCAGIVCTERMPSEASCACNGCIEPQNARFMTVPCTRSRRRTLHAHDQQCLMYVPCTQSTARHVQKGPIIPPLCTCHAHDDYRGMRKIDRSQGTEKEQRRHRTK